MSSNGYYITTVSPYGSASSGIFFSDSYNTSNTDFESSTGNNNVNLANYYWTSVAMSSNGQFQYAVATANNQTSGVASGGVFYSNNYGVSFTKISNVSSNTYWNSISISSNGQFITLVSGTSSVIDGSTGATGGTVYISNDSGSTFTSVSSLTTSVYNYFSVTMSSSGQYQTIVADGPSSSGSSGTSNMWTSSNYGNTWTLVPQSNFYNATSIPTWNWTSVSMSASGQYQTAVAAKPNTGDYIYISYNYGVNWNYKTSTGIWSAVAVSSSGQYQLACYSDNTSGGDGGLYFSQNYGNSFNRLNDSANYWYCCAISSSGQIQAAGIAPFKLYSSSGIAYGDASYGIYTSMQTIYVGGNKTFVIDHPCDKNKYLVHACLEGPEAGVYYRGEGKITNNKSTIIKLPYYVDKLACQLTVNLTPIYDSDTMDNKLELETIVLKSSRVKNNAFTVYGPSCEFFWTVYGKRNEINVEPLKQLTDIKGVGPYKWI
jgi:hypothetical protein